LADAIQGVFTLTMNERFNIDGGYIGRLMTWTVFPS